MDCPSCGYQNQPDRRHCASCGTLLVADTPDVPYLFVHAGPDRGEAFPLEGRMIAGRAHDVEICLDDPHLAPRHFAIERQPWQITIEDLDAPLGTIVGRDKLEPGDQLAVAPGTFIEAGGSLFEIVAAGAEPSIATPKVAGHPHKRRIGPRTRRALILMGLFLAAVVLLTLFRPDGGGTNAADRAKASTVFVATPEGSGSGIVIDADEGLLLTNHHVVANSRDVLVGAPGLAEGAVDGEVLATYPCEDVALVRVNGGIPWPEAQAIEVSSDTPRAGDTIFALGYPATAASAVAADGDVSVTGGIVSNPRTRYDDPASGVMPLQSVTLHDAAINPGSSGGPLVDRDGALLGMNTALYSLAAFRLEGQSYAITAERLTDLVPALRRGESTGDFGLLLEPYVGALTEGDDPEQPNGLVVRTVGAGGPAEEAGIDEGVLVLRVNGERVRTLGEWCEATGDRDTIDVDYVLPTGAVRSATVRSY